MMSKKFLTLIVIILIIITSIGIAIYNIPSENHSPIALAVADITSGKSSYLTLNHHQTV